jgi:hypothetical protein
MISRRIFLAGLSAAALAGCDSGDGDVIIRETKP